MKQIYTLSITLLLITAAIFTTGAPLSAAPRAVLYEAVKDREHAGDLDNFSDMPLWMLEELLAGACQVMNEKYSKENMLAQYGITKDQLHYELAMVRNRFANYLFSQTDGKAGPHGMVALAQQELEREIKAAEEQLKRALIACGAKNRKAYIKHVGMLREKNSAARR